MNEEPIVMRISPDGTIRMLHTDKIDLAEIGRLHVERASHVEFDEERQGWIVTLANGKHLAYGPLGEVLGFSEKLGAYETDDKADAAAFKHRVMAIVAEVQYLNGKLRRGDA